VNITGGSLVYPHGLIDLLQAMVMPVPADSE